MLATDALAVLPKSVVEAVGRQTRAVAILPVRVPHPKRALGILRLSGSEPAPAVSRFIAALTERFSSL